MSDEKAQSTPQPAPASNGDKPAAEPQKSADGLPGYKPPTLDPQLWHWVEKRQAPPAEATQPK
jgi:hypothetical protein